MKLDFTNEVIENEKGPNLYFMGSLGEFKNLAVSINDLADNGEVLVLKSGNGVQLVSELFDFEAVVFKQSKGKIVFGKKIGKMLFFEFNPDQLRQVSSVCNGLSKSKGHSYIEFDELLSEDYHCNLIFSSEW